MSTTANTKGCFREFIAQRVVGVLFDALPLGDKGIAAGTKTLVFEDGRGLTITSHGTYWVDGAADIARAADRARLALRAAQIDLAAVIDLAGLLPDAST